MATYTNSASAGFGGGGGGGEEVGNTHSLIMFISFNIQLFCPHRGLVGITTDELYDGVPFLATLLGASFDTPYMRGTMGKVCMFINSL